MEASVGFDLGARLKSLREAHGLSQRELAKRAGVSNAIISMIEQNRSSPSVGLLKKLLDGFQISLAEFFAADLKPRPQIFFNAEELVELAGGAGLLPPGRPRHDAARRCRSCTSTTSPAPIPASRC